MEKEEGEMSDDNEMHVDDVMETESEVNHTVLYKTEKYGLVIEELEKIDATKLEERAKRFGLNLTGNRVVTQKQIDELYTNFGIESGNKRHFRFDTLHLNGINGLTTREIFEYLEDYKPVSLEWIDDISCNVICQDHISAALALLVHSREIKNEDLKKMLTDKSTHHWREGMPHPKIDLILMRFATNGDKKITRKKYESQPLDSLYDQSMDSKSKNPWGDLCKSWGIYDHQEVFNRKLSKHDYEEDIEEPIEVIQIRNKQLAKRLGKRRHNTKDIEDNDSDSEWKQKSKTPRMRMHADDMESRQKKNQTSEQSDPIERDVTYTPLSIEVINSKDLYTPRENTKLSDKFKSQGRGSPNLSRDSIQSRLGVKVMHAELTWSNEECSSDNSDHNIMSRVQKVSNKTKCTSSVWSRLEKKQHETSDRNDLRNILKSRKHKKSDDLRERIGRSKKSNLRIEIENKPNK